jgi:hypothetical protein
MRTVAGFLQVLPTSEARGELSHALERFREVGVTAEPLVFGGHRKAEGVVLPFALFELLAPFIEDVLIAATARRRIEAGSESLPIDGLIAELGFDRADFK